MSGFERVDQDSAWTDTPERDFPDDFTAEEASFASELRDVFAVEKEDLPPLYAQTLIPSPRFTPAEHWFEYKLIWRVFTRLGLPRRPLLQQNFGTFFATARESVTRVSRPVAAGFSAALVFMAFTVALASPSFAQGLRFLLGDTGVQQVQSYPTAVQTPHHTAPAQHGYSLPPNQQLYWLGPTADKYLYESMQLTDMPDWASGPVVNIEYVLPGESDGTGRLDVREFQISNSYSAVLQVVQSGAATPVSIGNQDGVFVNGQWVRYGKYRVWQFGQKSELIFEQNNTIFWIVADQRDGTGQDALIAVAKQLAAVKLSNLVPQRPSLRIIGHQLQGSVQNAASGEVLELVPAGEAPESGQGAFVQLANDLSDQP